MSRSFWTRVGGVVGTTCALATPATALAADFGARGPNQIRSFELPRNARWGAMGGRLVVPSAPGRYPLVVAAHGWLANSSNQVGWAEHFASWGHVVAVPNLPSSASPDIARNSIILQEIVTSLADPSTASPAAGKVDGARVALVGHSAGALAVTVAARAIRPLATVLFDPVDRDDIGRGAFAGVCSPVLAIFAKPNGCNSNGNWAPIRQAATGPLIFFNVEGATHCDGENSARALCGLFCGGGASRARQRTHAEYATAFLRYYLADDQEAAETIALTSLQADTRLRDVSVALPVSCAVKPPPLAARVGPASTDADAPVPGWEEVTTGQGSAPEVGDEPPAQDVANVTAAGEPVQASACAASPLAPSGRSAAGWLAAGAVVWSIGRRRRGARAPR